MTTGSHVLLSSERMDWQTPEWFLGLVREVYENAIGFDPATVESNPTCADRWYTSDGVYTRVGLLARGQCGLSSSWDGYGPGFCNPVYGPHLSGPIDPKAEIWRKGKLIGMGTGWGEKIASFQGELISLVPVRTETAWWRRIMSTADLALLWGSPEHGSRISFVNPDTGKPQSGSNLASTVFYKGPRADRFREVFGPHGTMIKLAAQEEGR